MKLPKFFRKKKVVRPRKPKVPKAKTRVPHLESVVGAEHVGKHVALVGGEIIAAAKSAKQALQKAREKHPKGDIVVKFAGSEHLLIECKCLKPKSVTK
ncbi:MAG: DUF5678 domain-containing protein [Hadesarchaea archaeon]|nr:DUF5678 domain-containing protein [Hadesarchaea archaeon]